MFSEILFYYNNKISTQMVVPSGNQIPSGLDHTAGCYITNYFLASSELIVGLIGFFGPMKRVSKQKFNIRMSGSLCLVLNSLSAFLCGSVHQFYVDETYYFFFNQLWNIGVLFGL